MADSLSTRVTRVIAGGAHALLGRLEDAAPVAMLEQNVREVMAITDEVRSELGRTAANRHLAQQQHLTLNREHDDLSTALEQAIASGRDDLAKAAIARQLDIEAQLPVLEASLAQFVAQERELSGYVEALMSKQREMQTAIAAFEASRAATPTHAAPAAMPLHLQGKLSEAQYAFDRTYQRQTGLSAAARGASLEQASKIHELGQMLRDNKIAERLLALKAAHQPSQAQMQDAPALQKAAA